MDTKIQQLEINLMELKTDLKYIKDSVKQNLDDHKEILDKIDNLASTFQARIGDKADQKQIMEEFKGLDTKYAPYSFYRIFGWAASIVGGVLLVGLCTLIGRAYLSFF